MSCEDSKDDKTCPICRCDIEEKQCETPCGHKYHSECLFRWFSNSNSCPLCKSSLFEKKDTSHANSHPTILPLPILIRTPVPVLVPIPVQIKPKETNRFDYLSSSKRLRRTPLKKGISLASILRKRREKRRSESKHKSKNKSDKIDDIESNKSESSMPADTSKDMFKGFKRGFLNFK